MSNKKQPPPELTENAVNVGALIDGILGRQGNTTQRNDDHDEGVKVAHIRHVVRPTSDRIRRAEDEHGGVGQHRLRSGSLLLLQILIIARLDAPSHIHLHQFVLLGEVNAIASSSTSPLSSTSR